MLLFQSDRCAYEDFGSRYSTLIVNSLVVILSVCVCVCVISEMWRC